MSEQQFTIDERQHQALGQYIYALIDPRDCKMFYVGQGQRERVSCHFDEVRKALVDNSAWTPKKRRIQAIWECDEEVGVVILSRKLPSQEAADHAETACIAALLHSQNGPALNANAGPKSTQCGAMTIEELNVAAAEPVNPNNPYGRVFVFNVANALSSLGAPKNTEKIYEATRRAWRVSPENRDVSACAVGLVAGYSKGAFKIRNWAQDGEKWEFEKEVGQDPSELCNKNWRSVITASPGYWQLGNYFVIEFDGKGKFRFERGSSDHITWHPLV